MSPLLATGDSPQVGTLGATTVAASLGNQPCSAVLVQSDPGNGQNVLVGNSGSQTVVLQPGKAICIPCSNVSQIFVKAVSGTMTVNWFSID
jgi:hypothetical protein